jgi:O-antigen ligase
LLQPGCFASLKILLRKPLFIGWLLLFFIVLLSGLWSSDLQEWWTRSQVKLPLLLFPVGLIGVQALSAKQRNGLSLLFIGLLLLGACWSLYHYAQDAAAIQKTYLQAKIFRTPFEDDHVRFSWAVVIGLLLLTRLLIQHRRQNGLFLNIAGVLVLLFFVVYLHILSAKTGLIAFYLSLVVAAVFTVIRLRQKWVAPVLLLLVVGAVFTAYHFLPTFQNRVHYILYDFGNYSKGNFIVGLPDGSRVLSVKAGLALLREEPVKGVGFGDVWSAMNSWYDRYYPHIQGQDRLYPGGQWLMYGVGAGLGALLLFILVLLLPFFIRGMRNDITWWPLVVISCLVMLYEVNLESQFGVFLYVFFLLWWLPPLQNSRSES